MCIVKKNNEKRAFCGCRALCLFNSAAFFCAVLYSPLYGSGWQITAITGDVAKQALGAGKVFEARVKEISGMKGADLEGAVSAFRLGLTVTGCGLQGYWWGGGVVVVMVVVVVGIVVIMGGRDGFGDGTDGESDCGGDGDDDGGDRM